MATAGVESSLADRSRRRERASVPTGAESAEHSGEQDGNHCADGEPVAGGARASDASGSTVFPAALTPIARTLRSGTAIAAVTMAAAASKAPPSAIQRHDSRNATPTALRHSTSVAP